MQPTILIAIGGNSLMRPGELATVAAQRANVLETCRALSQVVAEGWRVVLTHGNGPQVGAALLRSERAADEAYAIPLDVCVASTQAEIGFLLQQSLGETLQAKNVRRAIATIVTQVVIAADDPAFARPSKPIGPFYSHVDAAAKKQLGWMMIEESPGKYRRVVASPEPLEIIEEPVIRALLNAGVIVITLGGGGIPVVREGNCLRGVEAVVDKDLASALLAVRLGVDRLVFSTDVDRIYLDFVRPRARGLDKISADELRRYAVAGHFPPGNMGPKVEAALRFVEAGGQEAIVTSPNELITALQGRSGTHVLAGVPAAIRDPEPVLSGSGHAATQVRSSKAKVDK